VAKKKSAKKKSVKKKAVKRPAKKTAKKAAKTKRTSGLTQTMCCLSEPLAAVVGAKKLTRPQVVKKLWNYIKCHKCQDTKNRRMINPDQKLSEVIGKKPVDMLKLATFLNKHISKS
jgi:chromatin remodeling complex protein RSC6